MAGTVQTVRGPVSADELGVTLVHEHIMADNNGLFDPSSDPVRAREPLTMENLWWVRVNPVKNLDNIQPFDEDLAADELQRFHGAGGRTVVDPTPRGKSPNPLGIRRVATRTGLHVILGCGWYRAPSHPKDVAGMTPDEVYDRILEDVTVGIDGTDVRAGIIGEIGCSVPLHPDEEKVLRAAAGVQRQTGVALSIHPPMGSPKTSHLVPETLNQVLDILAAEGCDPTRVIFCHMDWAGYDLATKKRLAEQGSYLAFDTFGYVDIVNLPNDGGFINPPGDLERVTAFLELVRLGYAKHLLLGQDIGWKLRLTAFGGTGYGHVLDNVVPLLRANDVSDEELDSILVQNPRRVLAGA